MAKNKDITVTVITPERQVLSESADSVTLPAHDGEIGILPDRAPIMCELGIGQLRMQSSGRTQRFFIDGGFAQVLDNSVTVLTPRAVAAADVTADLVNEAESAARAIDGNSADDRKTRMESQRRVSVLRGLQAAR